MNSRIILCSGIKLDRNYINVLSYTEQQMLNLCLEHKVAELQNCSFIRNKGTIQCDFTYSQGLQSNYIAFQNPDYSNKWFFAWIDEIMYKGEHNIEISYTVDSWSTWFEYWQKKPCYVLREHVNDDTIGANTIEENLNIGETIQEGTETIDQDLSENFWICLASSWYPNNTTSGGEQFTGVHMVDRTVFGTGLVLFPMRAETIEADFNDLVHYLYRTNKDSHIADITDMFIVPNNAVNENNLTAKNSFAVYSDTTANFTYRIIKNSNLNIYSNYVLEIPKQLSFSDYTPKNNKLLCYPTNYLYITNNAGSSNVYRYEDWINNAVMCRFRVQQILTIGANGRIVPIEYKNKEIDDDEAITFGKYPVCQWSADSFTNWLSQEGVNIAMNFAIDTISSFFGATQSGYNSIQNGASQSLTKATQAINVGLDLAKQMAGMIGDFRKADLAPNIQSGSNNGSLIFSAKRNTYVIRRMRAKTEYLQILDDYFSRFGYQINRVKEPNIIGRENFNYVQIGSSEEIGYGTAPSNHMENINNACRNGVTIWHNHTNLGNFGVSNNIV